MLAAMALLGIGCEGDDHQTSLSVAFVDEGSLRKFPLVSSRWILLVGADTIPSEQIRRDDSVLSVRFSPRPGLGSIRICQGSNCSRPLDVRIEEGRSNQAVVSTRTWIVASDEVVDNFWMGQRIVCSRAAY